MTAHPPLFAPRGSPAEVEAGLVFQPKFDANGLIAAIVTDAASGEVLMFAWMNAEALALTAELSGGVARGKNAEARQPAEPDAAGSAGGDDDRPYASPHFWAAFVLSGDPD